MIFKKFILLLLLIALVACNIENDCEKKSHLFKRQ